VLHKTQNAVFRKHVFLRRTGTLFGEGLLTIEEIRAAAAALGRNRRFTPRPIAFLRVDVVELHSRMPECLASGEEPTALKNYAATLQIVGKTLFIPRRTGRPTSGSRWNCCLNRR